MATQYCSRHEQRCACSPRCSDEYGNFRWTEFSWPPSSQRDVPWGGEAYFGEEEASVSRTSYSYCRKGTLAAMTWWYANQFYEPDDIVYVNAAADTRRAGSSRFFSDPKFAPQAIVDARFGFPGAESNRIVRWVTLKNAVTHVLPPNVDSQELFNMIFRGIPPIDMRDHEVLAWEGRFSVPWHSSIALSLS